MAATDGADFGLRRLTAPTDPEIDELADILVDCVDGGASVGFMQPLSHAKAVAFWQGIAVAVASGRRALLVAADADGLVGTVQLVLDQPDNQPHRADLAKMLVHRRARRLGLGERLIQLAEETARSCGKSLLVLDTATGGDAERLYTRIGWRRCGVVPGFAMWPGGGFCDTTFFYRSLTASR